jgi:hypothetical protein
LAALPLEGERYFAILTTALEPGAACTLLAEWEDGGPMLVFLRGHDPALSAIQPPQGSYSQVAINISGGREARINFTVDPRSPGGTAWLIFPSATPGRRLRVMLKSPGDPDSVTMAAVDGVSVGSVYKTPLHLFAP